MSGSIDRERLRQIIVDERGTTPRAVSRAAKLGDTYVRDILNGKSKRPELEALSAIAAVLGVEVSAFTTPIVLSERRTTPQNRIEPRYLPVRYRVRAGLWEEIEFAEPPVQVSHGVVPDPRYGDWPQWLELVEGDSVDQKIPPGHFAHVVDTIAMGYAPRDGDWVVVERRRHAGRDRERTIKQIEIGPRREVRLRTRSNNPIWAKHAAIALVNGQPVLEGGATAEDDATEVEIVGLVIGSYNPDF